MKRWMGAPTTARVKPMTAWALAAAMAVTTVAAAAQTAVDVPKKPRDVPPQVFFRGADLDMTTLSPTGKRLAVASSAGAGLRVGVVVFDLTDKIEARRAAQFRDIDVSSYQWVNDDKMIVWTWDRRLGSGRYSDDANQYLVSAAGGSVEHIRFERGDQLLALPFPHPGEPANRVLVAKTSYTSGAMLQPAWLNVETGRRTASDMDTPQGATGYLFDSHGVPRVAYIDDGKRRKILQRPAGSKDWTPLVEGEQLHMPFEPAAVTDDGQLYVTSASGPQGYDVLTRYDRETQAPEPRPLVSAPGFDYQGDFLRDAGRVVGVRLVTDAPGTVWFDPEMKRFQAVVDARFPEGINDVRCRRCGKPDMVATVFNSSDRDPGTHWVYRAALPEAERWAVLGRRRSDVDPSLMASVDFHRIKARDGRDLPVWITLPQGVKPGHAAPAIVLVHGGPWVRGRVWGWDGMSQFLASRGYLVIEPEFRGSIGYGNAHMKASFGQWGQAMQDDVADALLWAQGQKLATDKACIAGASYGGYAVMMGLAKHPSLYRCGAAWVGVTDLELLVKGERWVDDDSDLARKYSIPEMIGDPVKDIEMLRANSPVLLADRMKAPVLLAYGEMDRRVPLAHGERMRDALIKAGNTPEWVVYPGEGHGWAKNVNRVDFANRLEAFFAKHLGAGN
ncbi:alpha/beta hydrolase family protein [Roseateles sp. L2-2]|uniref:alpha/beta hydrolase family protein n=1 Tax=Roseateles sp. L2-2 TaxID=3422597 RepID=UPI003D36D89C